MLRSLLGCLLLICYFSASYAQVGIGTTTPDSKALLDLKINGTPLGLLLPRMNTATRTGTFQAGMGPAQVGMLVADTTGGPTGGLWVWNGAAWSLIQTGEPTWRRLGTDVVLDNSGDKVGIGISSPGAKLHVAGEFMFETTSESTIRSQSDPNRYLYFSAPSIANPYGRIGAYLGPATGPLPLVLQHAGGSVGIGITTPAATLDVGGDIRSYNLVGSVDGLVLTDVNGVMYRLDLTGNAADVLRGDGTWGSTPGGPWAKTGINVHLGTSTDKVGIGTATPAAKLEVATATGGNLRIDERLTWGGFAYPTLYTDFSDEHVFLHNTHIPYLENGQLGYAGTTTGARIRFAAAPSVGNLWDLGVIGGTDRFSLQRNSTDLFSVTNAGNVGIGSTTPDEKLYVNGNIRLASTDLLLSNSSGDKNHGLGWYGIGKLWLGQDVNGPVLYGNGGGVLGIANGHVPSQSVLSWNSAANVGIGTTTPNARLQVVGGHITMDLNRNLTTNPTDNFAYDSQTMTHYGLGWYNDSWSGGGGTSWMSGYAGIKFFTFGTPRMAIDGNGFVGIGNTTPPTVLSVGSQSFSVSVPQSSPVELLRFDNSFDNTGFHTSNRITLHNTGVWKAGIGISNGGVNYFSGEEHRFWVGHQNAVQGTQALTIDLNGRVGINQAVPTATLHLNGTMRYVDGNQALNKVLTSDAAGNATWQNLPAGITGTGTLNKVAVWNGANSLTAPSLFHWDNVNNYLGIGNAAPAASLHVTRSVGPEIRIENTTYAVNEAAQLRFQHGVNSALIESVLPGSNDVDLRFYTTDNNTMAQRMIILGNGQVGIGSMAPQHMLNVGDNTADGQLLAIRGYNNGATWKGGAAFGYTAATVIAGELNGVAQIGGHNSTLTTWTNLLINSGGGDVGIGTGTSTVEGAVDVYRGVDAQTSWNAGGFIPYGTEKNDLTLTRRHGTFVAGLGYLNNVIDFRGFNGSGEASIAQLITTIDPNAGGSFSGGMAFATSPGGTTDPAGRRNTGAAPQVRMWINHLGNVGIGNTAPTQRLDVTGNIAASGNIAAGGTVTAPGDFFGRINMPDTRAVNEPPTNFDTEVAFAFKQRTTIGAPSSSSYGGLMTIAPWTDNSGCLHHQLFLADDGIYYRTGSPDAATWNGWNNIPIAAAGTANNLVKYTGSGTMGNSQIIDNGTNVGIGIAPTAKLHVNGNFRLVDGTQGLGKVLTSDATGTASWATPPAAITTANNGLTATAGNVALGGTMAQNTTVTMAGKALNFDGYLNNVVDVNQTAQGLGAGAGDNTAYWQSWIVNTNGFLTQVAVEFFDSFGENITVTIFSGVGTGGG